MAVYLGNDKVDQIMKATVGDSVAWSDITGKPSSYTPSQHQHPELRLSTDNLYNIEVEGILSCDGNGNISRAPKQYCVTLREWSGDVNIS